MFYILFTIAIFGVYNNYMMFYILFKIAIFGVYNNYMDVLHIVYNSYIWCLQ